MQANPNFPTLLLLVGRLDDPTLVVSNGHGEPGPMSAHE